MNNFIKQLLCAVLLLSFAAGALSGNRCLFDYYTNQAVYLRNCENKSRPQLHCNGRCQLMKKMRQEDQQQQENQKSSLKTDLIQKDRFNELSALSFSAGQPPYCHRYTAALLQRARTIFHPPPVMAA